MNRLPPASAGGALSTRTIGARSWCMPQSKVLAAGERLHLDLRRHRADDAARGAGGRATAAPPSFGTTEDGTGTLALRASRGGGSFRIELEDDGRGIDWEAVRARCLAKGLRASTHDELRAGLFSGGVSTAAQITDISGRGVGSARYAVPCWGLGGELDVHSERGAGTLLRMRFPLSVQP